MIHTSPLKVNAIQQYLFTSRRLCDVIGRNVHE